MNLKMFFTYALPLLAVVGLGLVVGGYLPADSSDSGLGEPATAVEVRATEPPWTGQVSSLSWLPAAASLRQLLATTEVVVLLTFSGEHEETWEYPYDYDVVRALLGPNDQVHPSPESYFSATIDQIIYDDYGTLEPGDSVEIRYYGHPAEGWLPPDLEAPLAGEQRLLLMGPNPDGSYGPITTYHVFDIGGLEARYVAGRSDQRTLGFTNARAPQQFLARIRAELARRGPSPVPRIDFANLVPRPIAPTPQGP